MLEKYSQFMRETVTGAQVRRMSSFFDGCSRFVSDVFQSSGSVDIIFINNQGQPVTYIGGDAEDDRERLIDLKQNSLLKTFITSCHGIKKRSLYLSNVINKTNFND